ncbi:CRISPR-associated endonuclease/helicase Cas3 [Krasilnikovia cinnamomea]|uniref:CRISPR-associated endonuclease/helicase Cas3 n=1 Tax=Krasilnikovia cinnamomea TaxID=349313 RepID=A0A4Q7ZA34_9ACTN|nr:type I-U CRISPR-associated helicase/endonuclease Cas3 [Krasilnikovia cinnamomea]RZU46649.1 CRISPR-associated endonuclease/helicase Cas3 [Krasilnikovia cinnamomea]
MTLTASDFPAFVTAAHGREPFPWQQALVQRVLTEGAWPQVIDVPTGLGKTSLLDAAVFITAVAPHLGRRRIFFVVDRRLVVDEAHLHARRLQQALADAAAGSVAATVAEALAATGDDGPILDVTRMRGGATWDRLWAERPDRASIITGTVDQVGSRMLFRGYGVTEYARSIDAALVGTDSLIIIDEAHLVEPLLHTLNAAIGMDGWTLAPPPQLVTMSATIPDAGAGRVHTITAADEQHPVAGGRLNAPKRLHLVQVATTSKNADATVTAALTHLATTAAAEVQLTGAVVNTVARARAVFTALQTAGIPAVLLTGRNHDIGRDQLLTDYYPRLAADRDRTGTLPLVLVATQTVEVGANIDLDLLITESASLPALIQRLGRLNRLGLHPDARAIVVHPSHLAVHLPAKPEQAPAVDDDPVYGTARVLTWQWLTSHTTVHPYTRQTSVAELTDGLDACPAALRRLITTAPSGLREPQPYTPVLHQATLDAWTRTSPTPHPDPPIAPYLHGITDTAPAVGILWRSELHTTPPDDWPTALDAAPPAAEESVAVPLASVRRWLTAGITDPQLSDRDDQHHNPADDPATTSATRRRDPDGRPLVLRYRDRADATVIPAEHIRPGDLIVVPTSYGGCDRYGWHPESTDHAVDVADLARRRGNPILRLGPALTIATRSTLGEVPDAARPLQKLLGAAGGGPGAFTHDGVGGAGGAASSGQTSPAELPALLREAADAVAPDTRLGHNLRRLHERGARITVLDASTTTGAPGYLAVLTTANTLALTEDSTEASSATGSRRQLSLDAHQQAVAARATQIGRNLGLPEPILAALHTAAVRHDNGKIDPRFQAMLHGGDHLTADIAEHPLAKSGMDPADRPAFRRALRRSGYPPGMRHEALSAQLAAAYLTANPSPDLDVDLVVHLIAAHHGRNRPLLPPVDDPHPETIKANGIAFSTAHTVDWAAPRRFATLNDRYGRWNLALLETIVRLADIYCSARNEGAQP